MNNWKHKKTRNEQATCAIILTQITSATDCYDGLDKDYEMHTYLWFADDLKTVERSVV